MKGHLVVTVTGQGARVLRVLHKRNCPPKDARSISLRNSLHSQLAANRIDNGNMVLRIVNEGMRGVHFCLGRAGRLPAGGNF